MNNILKANFLTQQKMERARYVQSLKKKIAEIVDVETVNKYKSGKGNSTNIVYLASRLMDIAGSRKTLLTVHIANFLSRTNLSANEAIQILKSCENGLDNAFSPAVHSTLIPQALEALKHIENNTQLKSELNKGKHALDKKGKGTKFQAVCFYYREEVDNSLRPDQNKPIKPQYRAIGERMGVSGDNFYNELSAFKNNRLDPANRDLITEVAMYLKKDYPNASNRAFEDLNRLGKK